MKIKAEDLKPGHAMKHKTRWLYIEKALKRFYRNGRAKMEVTAKTAVGEPRNLILKADTLIEIYES